MGASAARSAPSLDPARRVGERVRALREARGFSLRDLAQASGVSAPMLSQVERGETSPTLAVAQKIAAGLGLSLSQLLRLDETSHVVLVANADRHVNQRDGHRVEELTRSAPGERASVTEHTLRPKARTGGPGDRPIHAPGSRETVVALAGRLAVVIDEERHPLTPGDAITFDADLPHHFENPGRGGARFLAVVTAGLRNA